MANTVNLNVRVDENLKHRAESIFNELGMNLTMALNLFLRSAVRYGSGRTRDAYDSLQQLREQHGL